MERNYKVYKHTSPSDKVYIGITKQNPKKRFSNGNGYKHNKHFASAINKYGWENFKTEILFDNLTEEEAKLLEQFYIALYDSTNREKGYNITVGGDSMEGWTPSEEWIEKHREAMSGENNHQYGKRGEKSYWYGKKHTEETKTKISEAHQGKKLSDETKAKLSKIHQGTHLSDETKAKISEKFSGENNPSAKAVICVENGKVFRTMKEASEWLGITYRSLYSHMKQGKSSKSKKDNQYYTIIKYEDYLNNQEAI